MGDHLEHGAVHGPLPVLRLVGDAEDDVAHVADRAVGDQLLEVGLGHRREGAVDDIDDPEQRHPQGQLLRRPRTYRIGDADDAVGAELEEDAGQDHADRRRRLDVGVRQPGVEREDRHLDGEADEQEPEHRVLKPLLEERLVEPLGQPRLGGGDELGRVGQVLFRGGTLVGAVALLHLFLVFRGPHQGGSGNVVRSAVRIAVFHRRLADALEQHEVERVDGGAVLGDLGEKRDLGGVALPLGLAHQTGRLGRVVLGDGSFRVGHCLSFRRNLLWAPRWLGPGFLQVGLGLVQVGLHPFWVSAGECLGALIRLGKCLVRVGVCLLRRLDLLRITRQRRGHRFVRGHEVAHVGEVKRQERDQNEHRPEQRVQEELDGRVLPPRPAPDADEEVHRQEHEFPEYVEEEEVQRQERAEHAGFQHQEQDAVTPHEFRYVPARNHRQETEDRCQQDERHADAVGTQEVFDVEARDPGVAGDPIFAVRPLARGRQCIGDLGTL